MNLAKQKPYRNKKYLAWVRTLPCCLIGSTHNTIAHHIIDCGMGGAMGSKASDLFAIPLNADTHNFLHYNGFAGSNIDQKAEALRTIEKAINAGALKIGDIPK